MSDELPTILDLGTDVASAEAPELLPVGEYTAEIRKVTPKASVSGYKYIQVAFFISPEDYPVDYDQAESPDGVTVTHLVGYPDAGDKRGIYRLRKFLEAIGVKPEGSKVNLDAWVGQKATINVKHSTYEGEARLECGSVRKDV